MRILLTGATGFIGSHAAEALIAAGHELRLLVRDVEKMRRSLEPRGVRIDDFVVGDITDEAAVDKALEDCMAVVHTAAVVSIEASRAQQVLGTNSLGVRNVVGRAVERGIDRIVYLSSQGALFTPGGPPIHDESQLAEAESAYGRSKTDAELFIRDLAERGAPIRCIYPPAVIGPEDPGLSEGNHTIRAFLKDTMIVTSSGFSTVDVRDLAQVILAAVDATGGGGRYVVAGDMVSWRDYVARMDRVTGTRVRRLVIPGRLLRALGRVGDVVKRAYPFDFPLTGEAMEFATQWPGAIDSPAVQAIGLRYRDPDETLADTVRWLHREGHVTARQAGQLARRPARAPSCAREARPPGRPLPLVRDERLGHAVGLVIGVLAERVLHEVRGRTGEGAADAAIEGQLGATDGVDRDARRVR